MNAIKSVLITGANAGLGFETARQMALRPEVEKVVLAARNEARLRAARAKLEQQTGRQVFEILVIDVADLDSVRAAANRLDTPVDAVVLNAGGVGGANPGARTLDGVTNIFAVNVLGHAAFVDRLLERNLINAVVLYAGSEAARGVKPMGIARPVLKSGSVDEFVSIADGTYGAEVDDLVHYGAVKLTAALWMASLARQRPDIRFVTMSPGGTSGTNGMDDLPFLKKVMFKYVGSTLMPLFGLMHSLDKGAKRFVDGLTDATFKTGRFYASGLGGPIGPIIDQATLYVDLTSDHAQQDNANVAIHRFIGEPEARRAPPIAEVA